MTTWLRRGAALGAFVLAFVLMSACATGDETNGSVADTLGANDTGTTGGAPGDALDARALGSLEGSCPLGAPARLGTRGRYENELERGEYVLLRTEGEVIDSIDARFGAQVVGRDSVLFIPIYADTTGSFPFTATIGEPVLCAAGERQLLRRVLPELDPLFSSPMVRDSTIYYWGMRPLAEPGRYHLTARRHHFPSGESDSLALGELAMYTDDRHHLRPPRVVRDSVIYETGDQRWAWLRRGAVAARPRTPPPARIDPGPPPDTMPPAAVPPDTLANPITPDTVPPR